jgi:hypothetical protein
LTEIKDLKASNKIKITEATPWEIKYFSLISFELIELKELITGTTAIIFTSRDSQKKNNEWDLKEKIILPIKTKKNPRLADINNINS